MDCPPYFHRYWNFNVLELFGLMLPPCRRGNAVWSRANWTSQINRVSFSSLINGNCSSGVLLRYDHHFINSHDKSWIRRLGCYYSWETRRLYSGKTTGVYSSVTSKKWMQNAETKRTVPNKKKNLPVFQSKQIVSNKEINFPMFTETKAPKTKKIDKEKLKELQRERDFSVFTEKNEKVWERSQTTVNKGNYWHVRL